MLNTVHFFYSASKMSLPSDQTYYLDARRTSDGKWIWETTYQTIGTQALNWNTGEPNGLQGLENCVEIKAGTGKWNDVSCNLRKRAVCQYP